MINVNLTGIRACVFDAYGTLFDVNSAAQRTQDALRDKWQQFAEVWRAKQLQYIWLRSLTGKHVDFWQLTSEALDFALDTLKLPIGQLRDHSMGLYLRLGAYPEVEKTLTRLKAGGLKCAILSNGSPTMLSASVENAGIADLLDAVLSVEELKVYKPYPTVYQLAVDLPWKSHRVRGETCPVRYETRDPGNDPPTKASGRPPLSQGSAFTDVVALTGVHRPSSTA